MIAILKLVATSVAWWVIAVLAMELLRVAIRDGFGLRRALIAASMYALAAGPLVVIELKDRLLRVHQETLFDEPMKFKPAEQIGDKWRARYSKLAARHTFRETGVLLPVVHEDGRREKFMPGEKDLRERAEFVDARARLAEGRARLRSEFWIEIGKLLAILLAAVLLALDDRQRLSSQARQRAS